MNKAFESAITLADVLAEDELIAQPYPSSLVLNDWRTMPFKEIRGCFARMTDSERRRYVMGALDLARLGDIHPAVALNILLTLDYAPTPPRWHR